MEPFIAGNEVEKDSRSKRFATTNFKKTNNVKIANEIFYKI